MEPGVLYNAPPEPLRDSIHEKALAAVGSLSAADRGAIVAIPTSRGVNAAIVTRLGDSWTVSGYIGKAWGEPLEAGGAIKLRW